MSNKYMSGNLIKSLENELKILLEESSKMVPVQVEGISKFLDKEYEKEINDQINFLKNITIMAGTVAPFSLTLLSVQSLEVQKPLLLFGFTLLLSTVLVALLSTKKLTIDNRYKDTSSLAFNHIIAECSVNDLLDKNKSLNERVDANAEIQKCIDAINNNFANLGYTNKLEKLRRSLSLSNQWSIYLFSFGVVSIIVSVLYPYLAGLLSSLISVL